jgi:hypothetical protein
MQLIVEASAHLHNPHTLPPRKRLWLFILHIFPVIITSKAHTFRIKQDEIPKIWTALHSSSSGNGPCGGFCENTNKLCIPQEAQSFLSHWAIAYITSNCSVSKPTLCWVLSTTYVRICLEFYAVKLRECLLTRCARRATAHSLLVWCLTDGST